MDNKLFKIQSNLYEYPYHYIPHLMNGDTLLRSRVMGWGMEYYSYLYVLLKWVENLNPNSLLDVGCGDGRFLNMLYRKSIGSKLFGIDPSERAINFAKCFSINKDIAFMTESIFNLKEKFEIVTLIEVLEHIPDYDELKFLKQVFNSLQPQGTLLLSVPTKNRNLQEKHYRHYNKKYFEQLLNEGNISYKNITYQYVFKKDLFYKFFIKLTLNKFYFFELYYLNRLMWAHIKNKLIDLPPQKGLHMLVKVST